MHGLLKGIRTLWSVVNKINRVVGFLFLLGIIYCIGGQIFSRWLAGQVWPWAEEVAEVFLIGTIVLYNGYAEQTDEHIRLEALFSIFPKLRKPMLQIGRICTMAMCAFIIYTEIQFLPSVARGTTKVARIPLRWIHEIILVGFVLYFIDLGINCYKHWKHIPFGLAEESEENEGTIFDESEEGGAS
jgi:TRAP-type C4-dicarboxylate transport system permease small subunit